MHLYDLPTGIPWLSLIWLSMLVPAIIMMFLKPEQKQAIRVVGTVVRVHLAGALAAGVFRV